MSTAISNAIKMPVKQVTLKLDDIGYEGWYIVMRTNPKAYEYDDFLSTDPETEWKGLQAIVLDWNFADDEGKPLALPKDGLKPNELPYDVKAFIIRSYIDAFNEAIKLPKPSVNGSVNTSSIGGAIPTNGAV